MFALNSHGAAKQDFYQRSQLEYSEGIDCSNTFILNHRLSILRGIMVFRFCLPLRSISKLIPARSNQRSTTQKNYVGNLRVEALETDRPDGGNFASAQRSRSGS